GFKGDDDTESIANRDHTNNVTVLSGDLGVKGDNSDNAYHVVVVRADATINGVTVTEGNTTSQDGGGIFVIDGHVTIEQSVVQVNVARRGGGVFIGNGNTTIIDSVFDQNEAGEGAGIYLQEATLRIDGSLVSENIANSTGGGI